MKQTISSLWSLLVSLAFSTLIYSTDSGIGGIRAALSFPNVVSILSVSLLLTIPMILCVLSCRRRRYDGVARIGFCFRCGAARHHCVSEN
jgi:hypothetical protein